MIYNESGYIVLKGSIGRNTEKESFLKTYKRIKRELIEKGYIKINGDKLEFIKDVQFTLLGGSAQILLGYSVSGPEKRKNINGKTLKDNESKI